MCIRQDPRLTKRTNIGTILAMDTYFPLKSYTASEARSQLYSLIRDAGAGLEAIEIQLRGSEPVIMMNKAELESWLESVDILHSAEEINTVRKSLKEKDSIPHTDVLKQLGHADTL